jgi:hypothetical protein
MFLDSSYYTFSILVTQSLVALLGPLYVSRAPPLLLGFVITNTSVLANFLRRFF